MEGKVLLGLGALFILFINLQLSAPLKAAPPAQELAVDAKIEIVWPHDGQGNPAPVDEARFVNVEAYLFEEGTLNPVACAFENQVTLHWSQNIEALTHGGGGTLIPDRANVVGERILREVDGKTFPVWIFNDVPLFEPPSQGASTVRRTTYFFIKVEGVPHRTNVWAHTSDARTYMPWQAFASSVDDSTPDAVDAVIQIVWPHDAQGQPRPVMEADYANIGVDLYHHDAAWGSSEGGAEHESVGFGFQPTVSLYRSLNDEMMNNIGGTSDIISYSPGPLDWPRWIFNDVDVSQAKNPENKYYFAVQVEGVETYTTIWAHGADPRTYFPERDIPAVSCNQ